MAYLRQIDREAYRVMLSGDSYSHNVIFIQVLSAARFIRKPFTKEKLQEYIKKYHDLDSMATLQNLRWNARQDLLKMK